MLHDLRYALRQLAKQPAFTAVVVLILGLAIGGNTAIFGAVRAVLLRPLAFPNADRLVRVVPAPTEAAGTAVVLETASPPDFVDWRNDNHVFSELAAMNEGGFALTGEGPAEQIGGTSVTGGFFSVMGVRPLLGRGFTPDDDAVDGPRVAVLGYTLWQRRFGGDEAVVGHTARFDGEAYTIVGVMPPGFAYPGNSEVWLPLRFTVHDLTTQRGAHYLDVIGRLKVGVTMAAAGADVRQIAARLAAAYPRTNDGSTARIVSLRDALVGDVRPALMILLGAVGLVLLVACANVASLMLVRGLARQRELAIRTAMGASRARLVRALLVESLLLATVGGLVGVLLAVWGTSLIAHLQASGIPFLSATRVDGPVLAFAATVTLVTGLLFGVLPAWQVSSARDVEARLKDESRGASGGRSKARTRNALVVAELALALVLLAGAGLLLRSFVRLSQVDLGMDPEHVLTFQLSLPDAKYPEASESAEFVRALRERIDALPGVATSAAVFGLPLSGFSYVISAYELDGRELAEADKDRLSVQVRVATPAYFRTLGIPLLRGRTIDETDRADAPPVMVVNQAAAKLLWPGQDPMGHRLSIGTRLGLGGPRVGGEVVGVVGDVHEWGPAAGVRPTIFMAHQQYPVTFMGVVVRTAGDPATLVEPARQVLAALDPDVPMSGVRTMPQRVGASVAQPRLYLVLLGIFAAVAILLAAVGIYGLLAQTVERRTREIGVRLALGAERRDIVGLVVRQTGALVAVAVTVGLLGAALGGRVLARLLFGVRPTDPPTLLGVAAGIAVVALVAGYLPARRAASVQPAEALRYE
jgi:putative ABC transport system permease protein